MCFWGDLKIWIFCLVAQLFAPVMTLKWSAEWNQRVLTGHMHWLSLCIFRVIVCKLYCQPDVWQLHLWRWPVPGAGRNRPVWASVSGLGVDLFLPGWWIQRHRTQTCCGAGHPFPSVRHIHTHDRMNSLHTSDYAFQTVLWLYSRYEVLSSVFMTPSVHRWFFKSSTEGILVGDGKAACDFPLEFGKGW